jgi:hypothetical protein
MWIYKTEYHKLKRELDQAKAVNDLTFSKMNFGTLAEIVRECSKLMKKMNNDIERRSTPFGNYQKDSSLSK